MHQQNRKNNTMYRITAYCDPYNAKFHYNGQEVIRRDGSTPIEWVIEDGFNYREDAIEQLMRLAMSGSPYDNGDWTYLDDAAIDDMKAQTKEDFDEDLDTTFYKGAGIYSAGNRGFNPILIEGEDSFWDDTMKYSVEEY